MTSTQALRAENREEHEAMRAEYRAGHQEHSQKIEELRVEVARLRAEMYRLMLLTSGGIIGSLGGLMTLFHFLD